MFLLANYQEERNLFKQLLTDTCHQRILFFRGPSGCGKSTLLRACLDEIPDEFVQIPIQLKETAVSVSEIFYRFVERIGWEQLNKFFAQVESLQGQVNVTVTNNRMEGQNLINIVLQADDPTVRTHRRTALTHALFEDLKILSQSLLLVLDTYEAASNEVREWINGPFLTRVARTPQVRILLAGQYVPDENSIEWGKYCRAQDLFGVREAEHWLPIVSAMHRKIDAPDPLSWLAGICHVLKGKPKDIMQVIENLPHKTLSI